MPVILGIVPFEKKQEGRVGDAEVRREMWPHEVRITQCVTSRLLRRLSSTNMYSYRAWIHEDDALIRCLLRDAQKSACAVSPSLKRHLLVHCHGSQSVHQLLAISDWLQQELPVFIRCESIYNLGDKNASRRE